MRCSRLASLVAVVVVAAGFAGCGSGDDEPAAPTQVTVEDLRQSGEFWNALTPDLKDELAEFCKQDLGAQRADMSGDPTVSNRIEAIDTATVVQYVDKQYTNPAKLKSLIKINCGGAIDEQIRRTFNEAVGALGALEE